MPFLSYHAADEDHRETRVFGLDFRAGEPVNVIDPHVFAALSANPRFEIAPAPKPAPAPVAKPAAPVAAPVRPPAPVAKK
jgi:hypothetical protein